MKLLTVITFLSMFSISAYADIHKCDTRALSITYLNLANAFKGSDFVPAISVAAREQKQQLLHYSIQIFHEGRTSYYNLSLDAKSCHLIKQ